MCLYFFEKSNMAKFVDAEDLWCLFQYCCVATNDYGSVEECAYLEVNSEYCYFLIVPLCMQIWNIFFYFT